MSGYGTHGVELIVEAAFGYAPYAVPSWTDVTKYVNKVSVRRGGAATVTPRAVAGMCTIELDNRDDRFDPNNSAGPYDPDVVVSVPIRVRATWATVTYPLFYGYASSWNVDYLDKGHRPVVTVPCVDGLGLLNQVNIADKTYVPAAVAARIGAVLTGVGWPAGLRNLDASVATVQGQVGRASTPDTVITAYSHLVDAAVAEVGRVFVAADGDFTFHNRVHHAGGATSEGTFGPADLPYDDVGLAYDNDFLYNDVRVTGTGGVEQVASDATSITAYGNRTLTQAGIMDDDNAALNVAEWEVNLFKDVSTRVEQITVKPQASPAALWPVVLGLDLRDSIIVKTDPKGGGDALNQQVTVESISHDITVDRWVTTFGCYPLSVFETYDYWILGTSELDTETRLA